MTIGHSKKEYQEKEKGFHGKIYIPDGTWLRLVETNHRILQHLNQDIREPGSIKCQPDIDKFTFYYTTLWKTWTMNTGLEL
jgi:hypothetical protein